jgi:Winged helix DNA-binding domain
MPPETLSTRTLNRTLLARQHLLERSFPDPIAVMEAMGGIQMQYAPAGYIGLWSRVRDFGRPTLTRLLEERRAVQGTMLRVTIHTVSAADYWPTMAGIRRANREWSARVQGREIGSTDLEAVAAAIREELAGGPLRATELTDRLERRGFPRRAFAWAATSVEMVRVPPSGTWERRRADLYALAERWLPPDRDVGEDEGIEHLVRRYLGAFGPAPPRDIAGWMGVNVGQMRHVLERMDLDLRRYRDERGTALLDLPDAEVRTGDEPAPPRFLPVWDATLLVHARRTGILPEEFRPMIFNTKTPQSMNTVLLDGRVAATWRFDDGDIRLSPLRNLRPAERRGLEEEAHRLAGFHNDTKLHEVNP